MINENELAKKWLYETVDLMYDGASKAEVLSAYLNYQFFRGKEVGISECTGESISKITIDSGIHTRIFNYIGVLKS